MHYLERKPSASLCRFVQSFWYVDGQATEPSRERMLPSGCAHILLSLSRDYLTECTDHGPDRRTSPALLVGQRSLYEIVSTSDFTGMAGVLFRPGAIPALLSDRADLISNVNLSLDEVWNGHGDDLREKIVQSSSPEARLEILESCIIELLQNRLGTSAWKPHPAVQFALDQLGRNPKHSIKDLARQSGWCERRFSQIFREQVGFTPKVWQRLRRFQHAVRELQAGQNVPWAEVAAAYGFYDQAHFANEFRKFAGIDLSTYAGTLQ